MKTKNIFLLFVMAATTLTMASCVTELVSYKSSQVLPQDFGIQSDSTNSGSLSWREYFSDPLLIALIDTALSYNQELNIIRREIEIARNEVQVRRGEYLPFVGYGVTLDAEKVGRYTVQGASEATTDIKPGKSTPEIVPSQILGLYASWEVDIWCKLRNAKKASYLRYLATVEGRNFMITGLVAEIANSYYELIALDNQLELINQNIELQSNAFEVVKFQKSAARVTEWAVKRFEAQLLQTKSRKYEILQAIVEMENHVNFLVGRFPQPVERTKVSFTELYPQLVLIGLPMQLIENRPDVREAEQNLLAAKLNVNVARANFYPAFGMGVKLGVSSFSASQLLKLPESFMLSLGGNFVGPLVNRLAIKAMYYNANFQQEQALFAYEQTLLKAFVEVANQASNIQNLQNSFDLREKEVEALSMSVDISNNLFRSARADYMEVLLTQKDALEAKYELIKNQNEANACLGRRISCTRWGMAVVACSYFFN